MKEVKITIPENYELIKEGDSYIVKKKQSKPKSWEEFCENFPVKSGSEYYINTYSSIEKTCDADRRSVCNDRNICTSKEEAEAFLALMQLRQLRKAWVGDWEPKNADGMYIIVFSNATNDITIKQTYCLYNFPMSFPSQNDAEEFFCCFKDLLEKAKILL